MQPRTCIVLICLLCAAFFLVINGCAGTGDRSVEPIEVPILQQWSGDYPVDHLSMLPQDGQRRAVGYIVEASAFAAVWQVFKPGETIPAVDFGKHFIVYYRNVDFYNRISIAKIILKGDAIEILARETMSSRPIEDKVALTMAVIPRSGIPLSLQRAKSRLPFRLVSMGVDGPTDSAIPAATAKNPLNAVYRIEDRTVRLLDGLSETEAAPGSAAKVTVSVFGEPVYGDIDGRDGVDGVLLLTSTAGGSGIFYYIAVAINNDGFYRGTRAVMLGDRIAPQTIGIRNGVIAVNYASRRPEEPMAKPPSMGRTKYLVIEDDMLKEVEQLAKGEEILDGWLSIGHEARSFRPCVLRSEALWLVGDSPALGRIMDAYRTALPAAAPYAALFVTLAGKRVAPPSDGFGMAYEAAFSATQLVKVFPQGNCNNAHEAILCPECGRSGGGSENSRDVRCM